MFTSATSQDNTPPIVYNPIDTIVVYIGDAFQFPIPDDAFLDLEDGTTPFLLLTLTTIEGHALPRDIWFGLNVDDQLLYGLPLEEH